MITYTVVENCVLVFMLQVQRIDVKRIYDVIVVLEPENKQQTRRLYCSSSDAGIIVFKFPLSFSFATSTCLIRTICILGGEKIDL